MIGDYESAKLTALSVLFVVLVIAAIVVGARDAKRQKIAHERRVRQQVALLERARAEAESQRRRETQAGNGDFNTDSFRPSEFASIDPSLHIPDRTRHSVGRTRGGGNGTFNAA